MRKMHVLFVCRGNVYRSAVAEQILKQLIEVGGMGDRVEVRSRGLQGFGGTPGPQFLNLRHYPTEWSAVKDTLAELRISLIDHVATPLSSEDIKISDLVVAIDEDVYSGGDVNLLGAFPNDQHKIRLFSEFEGVTTGVPDPVGSGNQIEHRQTILRIRAGVRAVFEHIMATLKIL